MSQAPQRTNLDVPDDAPGIEDIPPVADKGAMSQWQLIQRNFCKHRLAVASMFFLIFLYTVAAFAELFALGDPNHRNVDYAYCPPQTLRLSFEHGLYVYGMRQEVDPITFRKAYVQDPEVIVDLSLFARNDQPFKLWGLIPMQRRIVGIDRALLQTARETGPTNGVMPTAFLLGADKYGRDIFSRMIYGSRISLSVGLIGITFTFLFGMTIGGISGYASGWTDVLIQRIIEILQSFPQLPLWIALAAILPDDWSALRGYFAITVLLSLLNWTGLARVVRGKILSLREEDYAVAARLLGAGHGRVLFRHLVPGFTSHIIVALTLSIPAMILGETSLSFLGLGLRPPIVSWGVMLQDCLDVKAVRYYPWLLAPVFFIVVTVLSFNFMGDGLRDAADPYSSR